MLVSTGIFFGVQCPFFSGEGSLCFGAALCRGDFPVGSVICCPSLGCAFVVMAPVLCEGVRRFELVRSSVPITSFVVQFRCSPSFAVVRIRAGACPHVYDQPELAGQRRVCELGPAWP